MKKLDIYGGLLGAGKTSLIQKMLAAAYRDYKSAIIENETGKVNLDVLEFSNIQVRPLTSGCVCCTLKGNMVAAVKELLQTVDPDYIIIEATGAADLQAIREICGQIKDIRVNRCVMLVNAKKVRALLKVVGEFYYMQLRQADTIYLNFTETLTKEKIHETISFIREINPKAQIVSTPLAEITADTFPERPDFPDNPEEPEKAGAAPDFFLNRRTPGKYQLEVKDADERAARILPRDPHKTTLYTWTWEAEEPFTEETLHDFWENVKKEEIWRVKGIVSMADGTTRKLDYAFGDIFEKEKRTEDFSVLNKIVFIGKKK